MFPHKQYHGPNLAVLRLLSIYEHDRAVRGRKGAVDLRGMQGYDRCGRRMAVDTLKKMEGQFSDRPSRHGIPEAVAAAVMVGIMGKVLLKTVPYFAKSA